MQQRDRTGAHELKTNVPHPIGSGLRQWESSWDSKEIYWKVVRAFPKTEEASWDRSKWVPSRTWGISEGTFAVWTVQQFDLWNREWRNRWSWRKVLRLSSHISLSRRNLRAKPSRLLLWKFRWRDSERGWQSQEPRLLRDPSNQGVGASYSHTQSTYAIPSKVGGSTNDLWESPPRYPGHIHSLLRIHLTAATGELRFH